MSGQGTSLAMIGAYELAAAEVLVEPGAEDFAQVVTAYSVKGY